MAGKRGTRRVLCAALTADGKLDESVDPTLRLRGWSAPGAVPPIFCSGGPTEFRRLLAEDQVDELWLLLRPTIDGRRTAPTLSGVPATFFPASISCRLLKMEVQGNECLLRYRVLRTKANSSAAA